MATILRLTKLQKGVQACNACNSVVMLLPYSEELLKFFPADKEEVYVKASVKGNRVTPIAAVKKTAFK